MDSKVAPGADSGGLHFPEGAASSWLCDRRAAFYIGVIRERSSLAGAVLATEAGDTFRRRGFRKALKVMERSAADVRARQAVETMVLDLARDRVLADGLRAHDIDLNDPLDARAVAQRGYLLFLCGFWGNAVLGAARALWNGHEAAVDWLQRLIPVLLPAPGYPEHMRKSMRMYLNRRLMRDPKPVSETELVWTTAMQMGVNAALGLDPLHGVVEAATVEEARLKTTASIRDMARSAQREVFSPPADIPELSDRRATAWESGLGELSKAVLGSGRRAGLPLARILRTSRLDAARGARPGSDPTEDPLERDAARKRCKRGGPSVATAGDAEDLESIDPTVRLVEPGVAIEHAEEVGRLRGLLTDRQRTIADLRRQGMTVKEIAARLLCSPRTVEADHRAALDLISKSLSDSA